MRSTLELLSIYSRSTLDVPGQVFLWHGLFYGTALKCHCHGWCVADADRTLHRHGGSERPFYFGLLQQARIDQIFPSKVRPTVFSPIPEIGPSRLMHAQARCELQTPTTAAVVASTASGSTHAPWLASGAHAWAVCGHGANSANSNRAVVALFSARRPEIRAPLLLCFLLLCLVLS